MDFEKLLEEAAGKKLAGKKKQLQSSYDQSLADLAELEQGAAQQAREAATRRTAEAKQDRAAWNEIQTAQGLTSGAQSQALLAMDNQLRGDLTAIANTRDSATAELARKRQALARDLAQQLEQAQLESDYEQIMERYQLRKDQDSQAAQNQKAMAALLAQAGDFSLYGALYGLTPERRKTRRPWPPSWPRREISASTGPCTASPRSRSGGWRPIMRPSRNPRGTAAGWDVEAMFRGRVGITGSLASPNL